MQRQNVSVGSQTARWFVAEIVLKICVENDDRNVIHKNLTLIQATTPDEAYERAILSGKTNEMRYENPKHKIVTVEFLGLSDLSAVNDRLEDGAELKYYEFVAVPDSELKKWIPPREALTVFREIQPSPGPDYSSLEILGEALGALSGKSPTGSR